MEMVSLSQVMGIVDYKICIPMGWLASNTHHMNVVGCGWSAWSTWKAIDALHYDIIIEIKIDGSKFLDEVFMNALFSKIDTNNKGKPGPLEHLIEAMETLWVRLSLLCLYYNY